MLTTHPTPHLILSLDPRWKFKPQNVFIQSKLTAINWAFVLVGTMTYAPALRSMPTDMKQSKISCKTHAHVHFKLWQFRGLCFFESLAAIALIPEHFH